ncbi:hypothetical protein H6G77_16145 [Aulosira sp. FACHB-615]|nr:hypothetical protein [Aulosira sp. FACHB-615]MBD2489060.1 hypothetical protein [Aulosira sp. FACHB-615]
MVSFFQLLLTPAQVNEGDKFTEDLSAINSILPWALRRQLVQQGKSKK